MADYQPGKCNISSGESKKRYLTGGISLVTALIFSFAYLWLSSPLYMMAFAFIVYTAGFMGVLQGRESFCVKHGRNGTEKTAEEQKDVEDEEKLKEDRSKVNEIIIQSLILAVFVTGTFVLGKIYLL